VLKALVGAHEIELIRIFLTKSRQDGDLQKRFLHDKLLNIGYNSVDVYTQIYVYTLCVVVFTNIYAIRTSI